MTLLATRKQLTKGLVHHQVLLTNDIRSRGIHICAASGSGKSTILMGQGIAFQDWARGIPQLIIDPLGVTIDSFLTKVYQRIDTELRAGRITDSEVEELMQSIIYVDMSGSLSDHVVPFPLFYRLGAESFADIGERILDLIIRLSPELTEAPIMGWNSILKWGWPASMAVAALGYQISEMESFLTQPKAWEGQLRDLAQRAEDRSLLRVLRLFTSDEWQEMSATLREREITSFRAKFQMFGLDDRTLAMFGANKPGIDWQEVVDKRYTVLLDFRHETNEEKRRLKMLWAYLYFLAFVTWRGGVGRSRPIGLIVDELTELYRVQAQSEKGSSILAGDINRLLNVLSRNYGVWPTLSRQEYWQLDDASNNSLLGMGTQLIGVTRHHESAIRLAQQFLDYEPLTSRDFDDPQALARKVKYWQKQWMSVMGAVFVVEETPVEYSPEEWDRVGAKLLKNLGLFEFLVKVSKREGDYTGPTRLVKLADPEQMEFGNPELLQELRYQLSIRDGLPVSQILDQIDRRTEWQLLPATARDNPSEDADDVEEFPKLESNKVSADNHPTEAELVEDDGKVYDILDKVLDEMVRGPLEDTWELPFREVS